MMSLKGRAKQKATREVDAIWQNEEQRHAEPDESRVVAMCEPNTCENDDSERRENYKAGKPSVVAAHRACGDLHGGNSEKQSKPRERPRHAQESNETEISCGGREGVPPAGKAF